MKKRFTYLKLIKEDGTPLDENDPMWFYEDDEKHREIQQMAQESAERFKKAFIDGNENQML